MILKQSLSQSATTGYIQENEDVTSECFIPQVQIMDTSQIDQKVDNKKMFLEDQKDEECDMVINLILKLKFLLCYLTVLTLETFLAPIGPKENSLKCFFGSNWANIF